MADTTRTNTPSTGITRRGTMGVGIGIGALAGAGLSARNARAAIPTAAATPPNLPVEKGASLRVLRPAKFVEPDERIFNENSQKFAKLHGIDVRVDYAGWEDLRPQTAVTANTGAGPDVVVGWSDDPHLYADKLLDLTDIATYLGKKYGGWYDLAKRYGTKNGTEQWIDIPMGSSGGPMVYRESWVKEAGFNAAPKTTDELLACCRKLKENGHPAGFALGHATGDANGFCNWLVWSHGGSMVDQQGKVTINSKETIEALKYAKALYATFIPGTNSWLDTSNNKAMIAGQIGLTQNGVSLYFSIKNNSDPEVAKLAADVNHARMPIGPVGHSTENALVINAMIFKHTKTPNAAKAYLQFMMEEEQYNPWLTQCLGYWGQSLKAYADSDVWKSDPKIAPFKETMATALWPGYKGPINEPSGAVMADWVMVDMVAAAATGATSPEDAAREAERRAKRYYKG